MRPLALLFIATALAASPVAAQAPHASAQTTAPRPIPTVDEAQLRVKPDLLNRPELERMMAQVYPRSLRNSGRQATVLVGIIIDQNGLPTAPRLLGTNRNAEIDNAALSVVRAMRFTKPTLNGGPVRVRVRVPVTFASGIPHSAGVPG